MTIIGLNPRFLPKKGQIWLYSIKPAIYSLQNRLYALKSKFNGNRKHILEKLLIISEKGGISFIP